MLAELTNHIWQSTLFAAVATLMTFLLRKNRAQVRYWVWLSASLKFLVPFALLVSLGSRIELAPASKHVSTSPAVSFALVQISQPFPAASPYVPSRRGPHNWVGFGLLVLWACGFLAVCLIRFRGWRRIRTAVRSSVPIDTPAPISVRSSPGLLEPGVVGLFRPILLLPADITGRLQPPQLKAVLAHELCHIRRHDNLTSALHMVVEAVFWFYPVVWWIGARLVEERERACDEAVLSSGNEPNDYAAAILSICKSYLESPLSCVAGVTGSDLIKRIHAILAGYSSRDLTFARKSVLVVTSTAALTIPILAGILNAPPHIRAQSSNAATPKFGAVSIKTCQAFSKRPLPDSPGELHSGCKTLEQLISGAYGVFANGHANRLSSVTITGGLPWTRSDFYQIDAKAEGSPTFATMNGPMLQSLLENRFKLKIHRETKEVPVYVLTVSKNGPPLQPFRGTCIPWDYDNPSGHPPPPSERCGNPRHASNGADLDAATITDLSYFLLVFLDRPIIDETGLSARRFNFHLPLSPGAMKDLGSRPRGAPTVRDPRTPANSSDPSLISAIKTAIERLGLNLEPTQGPGEFLVIDQIEKPTLN